MKGAVGPLYLSLGALDILFYELSQNFVLNLKRVLE